MNGSRGCTGELLVDARLDEAGEMRPCAPAEMRIGPAAAIRPASTWSRDASISAAAACETRSCRGAGTQFIGRSRRDYSLVRDGFTPWAESQSASGLMRLG